MREHADSLLQRATIIDETARPTNNSSLADIITCKA